MSGDSLELNQVRKRLTECLGENAALYFQHLRNWFTKKCTKEEFDFQVRFEIFFFTCVFEDFLYVFSYPC